MMIVIEELLGAVRVELQADSWPAVSSSSIHTIKDAKSETLSPKLELPVEKERFIKNNLEAGFGIRLGTVVGRVKNDLFAKTMLE